MEMNFSDQLQLKKILVDLEDEHKHLHVSIGHLRQEIEKREVDIQRLLAERELKLAKEAYNANIPKSKSAIHVPEEPQINEQYSSEFAQQVGQILSGIARTSEELNALIKL